MGNLKTPKSLLDALRDAAGHELTPEEIDQQRVSFIVGSLKETNNVTRARVQEVLAQQEGKKG